MTLDATRIRGIDYRRAFDGASNGSDVLTCDIDFFVPLVIHNHYVTKISFLANDNLLHFQKATVKDYLAVIRDSDEVLRTFRTKKDMFYGKHDKILINTALHLKQVFKMEQTLTTGDTLGFGGLDSSAGTVTDAASDDGLASAEKVTMAIKSHAVPVIAITGIIPDEPFQTKKKTPYTGTPIDLTDADYSGGATLAVPAAGELLIIDRIEITPTGDMVNNIKLTFVNAGTDIDMIVGTTINQLYAMADRIQILAGDVSKIIFDISPPLVLSHTTDSLVVSETAASKSSVQAFGWKFDIDDL